MTNDDVRERGLSELLAAAPPPAVGSSFAVPAAPAPAPSSAPAAMTYPAAEPTVSASAADRFPSAVHFDPPRTQWDDLLESRSPEVTPPVRALAADGDGLTSLFGELAQPASPPVFAFPTPSPSPFDEDAAPVPAPAPAPAPSSAPRPVASSVLAPPLAEPAVALVAPIDPEVGRVRPTSSSRVADPGDAEFVFGLVPTDPAFPHRTTVPERVGFALAFLAPPLGIVAGIVSSARSARRRGWVPQLVSSTVVVGVVMSVALGAGAALASGVADAASATSQARAAAAPFCAMATGGSVAVNAADYGWPSPAASVDESLVGMQDFAARWEAAAAVAPASVAAEVTRVATTARDAVTSVTASRTLDDASTRAQFSALHTQTALPAFVADNCG